MKNKLLIIIDIAIIISIIYLLIIVINFLNFESINYRNDKNIVADALNNTNESVLKMIENIYIVNKSDINNDCGNETSGCVSIIWNSDKPKNVTIYIMSSEYYRLTDCNTFSNTIYHEIGHVEYSMKFGYNINSIIKENYAKSYASKYAERKCGDNVENLEKMWKIWRK